MTTKRKAKRVRKTRAWLVLGIDDSILSTPGPHWYRETAEKQCPQSCRVVRCEILYQLPRRKAGKR